MPAEEEPVAAPVEVVMAPVVEPAEPPTDDLALPPLAASSVDMNSILCVEAAEVDGDEDDDDDHETVSYTHLTLPTILLV